ncbi:MAG: flagellin [bacterium]|nr:flagellin [bacterium]
MSGVIVNHNIMAMNTRRHLGNSTRMLGTNIERLSSGLRINRGADDPSGLSVRESMRGEIGGLIAGTRNAQQGTNLIQTAEGALNEVSAILIRMRELAVQAATSTVNDNNRSAMNAELNQLISEIDRIANATSYNDSTLLNGFGNSVSQDITVSTALASNTTGVINVQLTGGAAGTYVFDDSNATDNQITLGNGTITQTIDIGIALDNDAVGGVVATGSTIVANFDRLGIALTLSGQRNASLAGPASNGYRDGDLNGLFLRIDGDDATIQVGPDATATDRIDINLVDVTSTSLGMSSLSLGTLESARQAIPAIDLAIERVTQIRGDLGAQQNRLGYTIRRNGIATENIQASESLISDADIAETVTVFTSNQIRVQAGTSLLAQANAQPQNALTLLQ